MTRTIQQLVELLERLPAAEQEKYGARWLGELLEGQGDGGNAYDVGNQELVSFDVIAHLLGVFEGGPPDLSTNPSFMEDFGTKKQGNKQ
ncbi:MAG: hypothetical protein SH809_00195 [Rhodothermales bacterium]|nr:hypothetical protein [Rhodothermales bacterium]